MAICHWEFLNLIFLMYFLDLQMIKPHVPLIKFRKGGFVQPQAPVRTKETISTDHVPSRYLRKPLSALEIETIERGGIDL